MHCSQVGFRLYNDATCIRNPSMLWCYWRCYQVAHIGSYSPALLSFFDPYHLLLCSAGASDELNESHCIFCAFPFVASLELDSYSCFAFTSV